MVGMRLKDKEEVTAGTSKSETFGTDSAIKTEAGEGGEQSTRTMGGGKRVTQLYLQQNQRYSRRRLGT